MKTIAVLLMLAGISLAFPVQKQAINKPEKTLQLMQRIQTWLDQQSSDNGK